MTIEDGVPPGHPGHPDDNFPRLVFADWLEERDDPRGGFIHVQCRLAQIDADDVLRFEVEQREDELLRVHQDE